MTRTGLRLGYRIATCLTLWTGAAFAQSIPSVISLSCAPLSFVTPGQTTCTVVLSSAPIISGGNYVIVSSSSANLVTPSYVAIATGVTSAMFTVAAGSLSMSQSVVLSAYVLGGTGPSATQTITLLPASSSSSPTLNADQLAFLTLINKYRAQNGAPPLQVSAALQNSSQWMSNDMATNNYFSHTDSLGRDPGTRMTAFGYPYTPWGENIAAGYSDAQDTFNQWEQACDPDASGNCTYAHRQNMLNPSFLVMGIGRAYSSTSSYGWYWTTDFGGVVDQTIPIATAGNAPVINSFSANPGAITAGQSAVLSWNVTGASSISINNGIGVTTGTSLSVSPAQTTTYTLTATNSGGTVTAQATVTVNPAPSVLPPTAPGIVSAAANGAHQVSLVWNASSSSVGVAGYQIFRNGSLLVSLPGTSLSYADTTVSPATTYTYFLKAYDTDGNYSNQGNTVQVTTAPAATSVACPGPATNAFTGCYYNGTALSGNPVFTTTDTQINFNWGSGSPAPSVTAGNFSVIWQGNFSFTAGTYTFTALASDGLQVYIDGFPALNRWMNQPPSMYRFQPTLTAGTHLITVEYYEATGDATITLSWQNNSPQAAAPVIASFTATPPAVTATASATLSWSVTGASSISINNGIGDVSTLTSIAVTPVQTTTYTLTASNSAGSISASVTVTVSAAPGPSPQPPPGSCPGPATNAFTGCYYNGTALSGNPVLVRTDAQIDFGWGSNAPAPSITASSYSVQWQGNFSFAGGTYTFLGQASDGMQIYIDGNIVLDGWEDQPPSLFHFRQALSPGMHLITVKYYEETGNATAQLSWH